MKLIRAKNLGYQYIRRGEEGEVEEIVQAVNDLSLEVEAGSFVAILGRNGSGKSTLAKQINALLGPTAGTLWIGEKDTREEENLWAIRETAGMVFQNPDNQIIATVVEEDVGFGPENIGVPTPEIWQRVEEALRNVGMTAYAEVSPNRLSGGQKQRVAIAGVMAMKPQCIILDEPTAMLDPGGREEVLRTVEELNRREHITVLLITHYMEETVHADRVLVMQKGRLVMDGTPREVFARLDELKAMGLTAPQVTELAHELRRAGLPLPEAVLTVEELTALLTALWREKGGQRS